MKVNGKLVKLRPRFKVQPLGTLDDNGEMLVARLHAPKLGMVDRLFRDLPEPEPPQRGVVKDKRGEVVRDAYNKPLPIRDVDDPEFLRLSAERHRLVALGAFLECTAGQFEWEAKRESFPTLADYLRAVMAEMEAAGIDQGTFQAIDAAVAQLTRPTTEADHAEVNEAREALGAPPSKAPAGK